MSTATKKGTKRDIRRRQSISSSGADAGVAHRVDFTTCPCCPDWEHANRMESLKWFRYAVTLVMEPSVRKSGCVAVISECPECFGLSWVHQDFTNIIWGRDEYPSDWRRAAEKRRDALRLQAQEELVGSLCFTCRHLEKSDRPQCAPYWRDCIVGGMGTGPVVPKSGTCPKYELRHLAPQVKPVKKGKA